jgi:hypothetical protein
VYQLSALCTVCRSDWKCKQFIYQFSALCTISRMDSECKQIIPNNWIMFATLHFILMFMFQKSILSESSLLQEPQISNVSCLSETYFSVMKLFHALRTRWNPTLLALIPCTLFAVLIRSSRCIIMLIFVWMMPIASCSHLNNLLLF